VVLRFKKAMQMTIMIHGLCPDAALIGQVSEVYGRVGGVPLTPEAMESCGVRCGEGQEDASQPRAAHLLRCRHSHGGSGGGSVHKPFLASRASVSRCSNTGSPTAYFRYQRVSDAGRFSSIQCVREYNPCHHTQGPSSAWRQALGHFTPNECAGHRQVIRGRSKKRAALKRFGRVHDCCQKILMHTFRDSQRLLVNRTTFPHTVSCFVNRMFSYIGFRGWSM